MPRTRIAAFAALLGLGATGALAQGAPSRGWYVGADFGQSKMESDSSFIGAVEKDDTSTTWALRFGYQFSHYFGLEGGYADFGDFGATFLADCPSCQPGEGSFSMDGYFVNVIGTWPVARHFHLKGVVGLNWRDMSTRVVYPAYTSSWSEQGETISYGIGAAVPINDRFELDLGYTKYQSVAFGPTLGGGVGTYSEAEAALMTLGLRLRF